MTIAARRSKAHKLFIGSVKSNVSQRQCHRSTGSLLVMKQDPYADPH
jgi:hypothetical protein